MKIVESRVTDVQPGARISLQSDGTVIQVPSSGSVPGDERLKMKLVN